MFQPQTHHKDSPLRQATLKKPVKWCDIHKQTEAKTAACRKLTHGLLSNNNQTNSLSAQVPQGRTTTLSGCLPPNQIPKEYQNLQQRLELEAQQLAIQREQLHQQQLLLLQQLQQQQHQQTNPIVEQQPNFIQNYHQLQNQHQQMQNNETVYQTPTQQCSEYSAPNRVLSIDEQIQEQQRLQNESLRAKIHQDENVSTKIGNAIAELAHIKFGSSTQQANASGLGDVIEEKPSVANEAFHLLREQINRNGTGSIFNF